MKNFFERYIILTKEERLLVGGILLIVICGMTVMYFKRESATMAPVETSLTIP